MVWSKESARAAGGRWRCVVKKRERTNRYKVSDKGRAADRRYYASDKGRANKRGKFVRLRARERQERSQSRRADYSAFLSTL
jgi:hypothetical protein